MKPPRNKDRVPRPWPRYMTARVAADFSSTSPWTIRRNVQPCGQRGRALIYAIEDVERWMRGDSLPRATAPLPLGAASAPAASLTRTRDLARVRLGLVAVPLADDADSLAP